jgi:hypothetical protein
MTEPRPVSAPDNVTRAAQWLADRTGDQFGVIIPTLKQRFELTAYEAAQACTLAKQFRINRRAFS